MTSGELSTSFVEIVCLERAGGERHTANCSCTLQLQLRRATGGKSKHCNLTCACDCAALYGPRYELRASSEEERENLNISECRKFQAGQRLIAIISDAASTGALRYTAATPQYNQPQRMTPVR